MDEQRKRLLYLSTHRGMKETDVILGSFARAELAGLNEVQLSGFEALLAQADQDILAWLLAAETPPAAHSAICELINQNMNKNE